MVSERQALSHSVELMEASQENREDENYRGTIGREAVEQ